MKGVENSRGESPYHPEMLLGVQLRAEVVSVRLRHVLEPPLRHRTTHHLEPLDRVLLVRHKPSGGRQRQLGDPCSPARGYHLSTTHVCCLHDSLQEYIGFFECNPYEAF